MYDKCNNIDTFDFDMVFSFGYEQCQIKIVSKNLNNRPKEEVSVDVMYRRGWMPCSDYAEYSIRLKDIIDATDFILSEKTGTEYLRNETEQEHRMR